MDDDRIKVLFIAGSGRSGSTILHNILAQIEGFFAVGELRYVWERGLLKNRLCGCGRPFRECDTWLAIMEEAFGSIDEVDAKKLFRKTESFRIKHLPLTLVPSYRQRQQARLAGYLKKLESLYAAIMKVTESRVIVDSSKNPSYGYVLRMIPTIDLYVLHFIRDSHAVAYSWSKRKEFQPGDFMARKSFTKSALQWDARNLLTEAFLKHNPERYIRLRYEAFIDHPRESIEAILQMLEEPSDSLPFLESHVVQLSHINHSVFGNPVRFEDGPVKLRLDNKWQSKITARQKNIVSGLTLPLRLRYGYVGQRNRNQQQQ